MNYKRFFKTKGGQDYFLLLKERVYCAFSPKKFKKVLFHTTNELQFQIVSLKKIMHCPKDNKKHRMFPRTICLAGAALNTG